MVSHPQEWAFVAALVAAMVALHWTRRQFWLFTVLVLPGTLAHEACHLLLGVLLNGRPTGISLWPHRAAKGWVMGSVAFGNLRWYNAFFVGMAPLLLLPLAYWLMLWRVGLGPGFHWQEILAVYLIANLIYATLPSWTDVKVAARSPVGWLLLAGALVWAYGRFHQPGKVSVSARVPRSGTLWPFG